MQTVQLSPQDNKIIAAEIEAGHFETVEQTIEAALLLLKEHQTEKLVYLREIAREAFDALDRGEGIALKSAADIDAFLHDAVAEARRNRAASHA